MLQAVLHSVPLLWVEDKHLLKQAVRVRVRLREDLLHRLLVAFGELLNVLARQIIANEGHVITVWSTQNGNSPLDLVEIVVSWEKWCSTKQLSKDATERPHVKRVRIVTRIQDYFRSAVPPSHNVFSQRRRCFFIATGEAKIADL